MQSTSTAVPRRFPHSNVPHPHRLAQIAAVAIAGLVFLNASAWLLPLASEFSVVDDTMSELVLGRFGFIQTAAFLAAGIGILGLAFTIRSLTQRSWQSRTGSLLVAMYGVGAILAASFPTDRIDRASDVWSQSPTGTIHVVVALISFLCVIPGMFLLTWDFFREARWRRITSWWMMLFPSAALALFFVQSEGPRVGLNQRLFVAVVSTWLILVALKVRRTVAEEAEATG